MTIMNASPSVKNSFFDGASAYTDMVRIGGESSPTFDHVQMQNAHCGFHTFGGVNTSPRITNSVFQNLSYGIMAFQTKPSFERCVFTNNTNDVGLCLGAQADNAPVLSGNYYASGSAAIDAGCFAIGTNDPNPASSPIEGAGPVGLWNGTGLTGTRLGRGHRSRGRRSLAAIGAIAWSLASSNALAHVAQARSAAFSLERNGGRR